ncbi:MAG: hypothetical protein A3I29_01060 [Candidatus Magasanikbacteria bacterium RIFCSPLOWO2_02_FULL_44_11]|uniref:Aspartyl/glutamyl-tRNA(Asn/Gln) amidotransferase subunit C n=2 Tax=Candidatus Magasanikiibacteriota TaxID=1752731 RepID=A0A1F6N9V2_9BACT|nr:MAG: hypothetical protein A3D53_02195 [Candidatus Magasanikbacteria bacterium RIFCSPHIGHO2_02_FULL_45_10]OGH80686.1 MAG: hypothetical protein A3I29_01060 [Candidatus Magasanikbacteria bacterium RIFCSPLOWO2_02_FULL_44_11]
MTISKTEIKKIAELARLKLTTDEETHHAKTISAVLDYMNILNEVDTTGVEPTAQVTGLKNIVRYDEVKPSGLVDKLVKNMPRVERGELVVPAVLED